MDDIAQLKCEYELLPFDHSYKTPFLGVILFKQSEYMALQNHIIKIIQKKALEEAKINKEGIA